MRVKSTFGALVNFSFFAIGPDLNGTGVFGPLNGFLFVFDRDVAAGILVGLHLPLDFVPVELGHVGELVHRIVPLFHVPIPMHGLLVNHFLNTPGLRITQG